MEQNDHGVRFTLGSLTADTKGTTQVILSLEYGKVVNIREVCGGSLRTSFA